MKLKLLQKLLSLLVPIVFVPASILAQPGGCVEQCITCDQLNEANAITVDQNITIDFNTPIPTYTGDPDLLPYFTYDKSGPTPDTWKALFNLGPMKLLIKNGATITVTNVPNSSNNQQSPGIVITSSCELEIEEGGHIVVNSLNQKAGDIVINVNGNIIINGEIRNEVSGTNGMPGAISVRSSCGNIIVGSTGLLLDLGVDPGGNTISLETCGNSCQNGDITVSGLVKAYARAHAGDLTLNRPTIKVISINGAVTINANTPEPLYDEFPANGVKYDIWGGLLAWVRDNVNPGKVYVQAKNDILVNGHGDDPTAPVRKSFGAIASISTMSSAPGGLVDVRSMLGNIIANDRAFDVSGRNRLSTNFAHINLEAGQNISLNRLGSNNSFNPVVDASSPSVGDKGGQNDLRSYAGNIFLGTNAVISANVPAGSGSVQGSNNLASCLGVVNNGTINPADTNPNDDLGVCNSSQPVVLFENPCGGGVVGERRGIFNTAGTSTPIADINAYPNPFKRETMIRYVLPVNGKVQLSIYNLDGRRVITLVDEMLPAGVYQQYWNAEGLPAGMYMIRLNTGNETRLFKIVLTQ